LSDRVVVLCTVPNAETAEQIAVALVERRLAACVNVVAGVTSVYRWQGEIAKDSERLLIVKTRRDRFEALREAIVARHPYEVPEVVALEIAAGHEPYLSWLDENVAPDD
jgi:periplasmic divalent cation tolerance protein